MSTPQPEQSTVELPPLVTEPFEVYLNGVLQQPEVDFRLDGRTLVFPRTLVPEVKMRKYQWALVTVGIGSYAKHDSVDIVYEYEGRRLVAHALRARKPGE